MTVRAVRVRQALWAVISAWFLFCCASSKAASVTLAWDPSSATNVAGYTVYYGTSSGDYTTNIDVGDTSIVTVSNLNAGQTYYFAVLAYDSAGQESPFSNEITNGAAGGPEITNSPVSQTVAAGTTVAFSVGASGASPLSYQWFDGATAMAGETNATLILADVSDGDDGNYSVVVSNSAGSVTSDAVTLSVVDPPAITSQPVAQNVVAGSGASFSVGVSGTAPFTYQWFNGATALPGATNAGLTLSGVSDASAGNYSVVVVNSAGSVTSSAAALTVIDPPVITSQPAAQSVSAGLSASFSVVVSGTAPFTYQWFDGASALSGATSATLVLSSVSNANAGNYKVVVANSAGSVTSSVVALTVINPPVITSQPVAQSVALGASANFSVGVSGTAPFSYQWFNGATVLPGATNATLTLASVSDAGAGNYSVVVSNSAGSVTSRVAALTVIDPPVITSQPVAQSVSAGASASFSVGVSGTAPFTYQWFDGATALSGAPGATLTLLNVSNANAGNYSVVVANGAGSVTSSVVALTVIDPPVITSQPVAQSVGAGANANFSVGVSGTAPFSYQWFTGATALPGATNATLTLASVSDASAGSYSVVVSNSAGSVTSSVAALTVIDPPVITSQPIAQSVSAGSSASFSVGVAGTAPFTYQWFDDASALSGATSATLVLSSVSNASAGNYKVVVANSAGSVTSSVVALTVIDPPVITSQPLAQSVALGASANFSVGVSGTAPFSYQWFNGATVLPGATSATLTLASVSDASAGSYSVVVSNSAGSVTSSVAALTVIDPPVITSQPIAQSAVAGTSASFSVGVSGTAPFTYQWFDGATALSGVPGATLTLLNVSNANAGNYSVVVANGAGSVTSSVVALTVIDPPVITSRPVAQSVPAGSNATFSVGVSGTAPFSYQWFDGVAALPCATNATLTLSNVSDASAGSYSVVVTNNVGSATSRAVALSIIDPPVITSQPLGQNVAAGGTATFSVDLSGTAPFAYQWFEGTTNLPGATNAALILSSVSNANDGSYGVVVSNGAGSVTSSVAALFVINPPVILSQPASQSVASGASVSFNVSLGGTAPFAYQWYNGATAIPGATNATLTLLNASMADSGNYSVTAQNAAGSVTSSVAVLNVASPFVSVAGAYNGLFYQTNGSVLPDINAQSAGLLGNCVVETNGVYSGRITLYGFSYPLAGTFNTNGDDTEVVSRAGNSLSNLNVTLHLDMTGETQMITGTVSNTDPGDAWTAVLAADLATNGFQAPSATMLLTIPPAPGAPPNSPEGSATITSSTNGMVILSGRLFDGSQVFQSVPVSSNGNVPLYFNLYGGMGLIEGWINISSALPTGTVTWIRPGEASTPIPYPQGFTNIVRID